MVLDAVYDEFMAVLAKEGGIKAPDEAAIVAKLWPDGHLNRSVIAQDTDKMLDALALTDVMPEHTKFLLVETKGIGPDHPLSGEKLSRVAALYRASDFDDAVQITSRILAHQGAGHSVGLHSANDERALTLGHALPTSRVIVNQAHCFATGGAFNNGMPFSLSMGCGSWGGNSIDENFNHKHLMNITKVVRTIPTNEPTLDEIFGDYWQKAGR